MESPQATRPKKSLTVAFVAGILALCALVLLFGETGIVGSGEKLDKRMAVMRAEEAREIYDGASLSDSSTVDPATVDLAVKAEEYLKSDALSEAETEEEARRILSGQLVEGNEEPDLLDGLVDEWKLTRLETSADSQSSYYVNKPVTGRFGGGGGKKFVFYKRGRSIAQVCVRSGSLIDAIKVRYSDGSWSSQRGGRGGQYHCTKLAGKCITSVFVKAGSLVDGLLFGTRSGAISPYYGGYGGRGYAVSNYGACLYKIVGKSGRYVDSLQFFFGKKPSPPPKPVLNRCRSTNVALRRPTKQSSIGWNGASKRGVDGNPSGNYWKHSCTHTKGEAFPWWFVNIGRQYPVCAVKIFNRRDCCAGRLANFKIFVTNRRPGRNFRVRSNELCYYYRAKAIITARYFKCYKPMRGAYVGVQIMGKQYLTLCEVQVFTTGRSLPQPKPPKPPKFQCKGKKNVALRGPTGQKTTGYGGSSYRAVDGNPNPIYGGRSCTHTGLNVNPWWYVNIGGMKEAVCRVTIFNRKDCCGARLNNFKVFVTNRKPSGNFVATARETCYYDRTKGPWLKKTLVCNRPLRGRYVGVQILGKQFLTICEFQVFMTKDC